MTFASSNIKLDFRYDQTSARLLIEGVPDISIDQSSRTIGIITLWKLELVGFPQLEGKLEHLKALMNVVIPYARYRLSGIRQSFGNLSDPVSIYPCDMHHEILLKSSQEGIEPLKIKLDDAELSDLVRCLDDLRLDERVQIHWEIPPNKEIERLNIPRKKPFIERFGALLLGISTFISIFGLFLYIPLPVELDKESPYRSKTTVPIKVNTKI